MLTKLHASFTNIQRCRRFSVYIEKQIEGVVALQIIFQYLRLKIFDVSDYFLFFCCCRCLFCNSVDTNLFLWHLKSHSSFEILCSLQMIALSIFYPSRNIVETSSQTMSNLYFMLRSGLIVTTVRGYFLFFF